MLRPMAPGYLYKPPGAGQRVTSLHPPDHQSASHVGYLRMNHLSPWGGSAGWPNWSGPFIDWAEREGYEIDVVTNADLEALVDTSDEWIRERTGIVKRHLAAAGETGAIVTAENNMFYGGLGSAVAEVLVENNPIPMKRIGVRDTFAESGPYLDLLEKYGLSANHIEAAVEEVIARK